MLSLAEVWPLAPVALSVCLAGSADLCNCVCMLSVCTENHSQCNDPYVFVYVHVVFVKWVRASSSFSVKGRGEENKLNDRERGGGHSCYSKTVCMYCYVSSLKELALFYMAALLHSYKSANFLQSKLPSLCSILAFAF